MRCDYTARLVALC